MKRRQGRGGPRLPLTLQKELHIDNPAAGFSRRRNDASKSRRDVGEDQPRRYEKTTGRSSKFEEKPSSKLSRKDRDVDPGQSPPRSLSKKKDIKHEDDDGSEGGDGSEDDEPISRTFHERESLPDLKLDRASKTFRYRAAEDDAEIAALEKKLGVKGRKKTRSSYSDGLDDLLMDLDSPDDSEEGEALDEVHDRRPRKRLRVSRDDFGQWNDDHQNDQVVDGPTSSVGSSDLEPGESDDESHSITKKTCTKRENPYVAPPPTEEGVNGKYVPPSLRKPDQSDQQSSQRLRRQLQGQINRLTEANMLSILKEVEKLYQSNARQDVTSALTDQLLVPFCERSALQTTFTILHAAFLTAMYKVIGTEFGVHVVSVIVQHLETFQADQKNTGKQSVNLLSLLCHLYTFRMISSHLIFDHISNLLQKLDERNSEILLRVVRDSGPQLRQDDPSSLKAAVISVQNEMAQAREKGQVVSVRTQFMVETIVDLRNNKLKHETASHGMAKEHIVVLRKLLGSMASRSLRASEPMRLGISDLKDAGKRGQWLRSINGTGTGSNPNEDDYQDEEKHNDPDFPQTQTDPNHHDHDDDDPDFLLLARQNGMNTVVRRAIFTSILSSHNHIDALARLHSLRLKKSQQQQEIPRVVLHCLGMEEGYNPYYTLITKELCLGDARGKKLKMAFQFALWGVFRRMGEGGDDDGGEEDGDDDVGGRREEVQPSEIVNLAKMYGALIVDGVLALDVLKVLSLKYLSPQTSLFAELMLGSILLNSPKRGGKEEGEEGGVDEGRTETVIARIFSRALPNPKLASGLRHFLGKVVRHTELFDSRSKKKVIKRGCVVAVDALKGTGSDGQVIE